MAYNRCGLHNFCLVLFHNLTDLVDVPVEGYTEHVDIPAEVVEPDEAMREAIWQAEMWHLDELLDVTVTIDPGLDDFLDELKPGDPTEAN